MDIKYEDYLSAGTEMLMEFFSAPDIEEDEKIIIVSSFSSELSDNIGDTSKLQDYELIIYKASVKYIDEKISKILADAGASYSDCEKAVRLCAREKELIQYFTAKKWDIPLLSNYKLDNCVEVLKKRMECTSISEKIREEDHKIDELRKNVEIELCVNTCDIVLGLLDELANDLAICKKKKAAIPAVNNKDTKKIARKILDIRKIAEQKEALYHDIFEIDLQIHGIISLPKTFSEHWREIISLCEKQVILFSECNKRRWQIPAVKHNNPVDIVNKYKHFLMMEGLDKAISSNRNKLSNKKQYKAFFSSCTHQQENIEICKMNSWEIPELIVTDPSRLLKIVQEEKNKKDRTKLIKRNLILIGIGLTACLTFALFCIYKYREGKVCIPFDEEYVLGKSVNSVYRELETAGFENIQKQQDFSGWLDGDKVLNVTIDNRDNYDKGSYKKPDVSVVITYSSPDRIYVTDILTDWENTDYKSIVSELKKAGFTNIETRSEDTFDKSKDQLTASLVLNYENYINEHCYLPKNAPIIIFYYTLKIGIGNSNMEFIGQNYREVVAGLQESGFTNVQAERINNGWAKGNTVVGVTVNNTTVYESNKAFAPDVKIVVKYSSDNRIDAASIMENWDVKDYEELRKSLKNKGFTNITVKEKVTDDKSLNRLIASVIINNELFGTGDCYVQKNAPIELEYYVLKIAIGKKSSSFISNTEGAYSDVVSELRDMGFVNIRVLRKNDLVNGWITKEGSIDSISINGNDSFSETDNFYFDDQIVIVVHTFKNSGCDDIIETAD